MLKKIIIHIILLYRRYLSPDHSLWAKALDRPPFCKHIPSCSDYTLEAIERKGVVLGSIKSMWRILRCNPWSKGGYDPVEKNKSGIVEK